MAGFLGTPAQRASQRAEAIASKEAGRISVGGGGGTRVQRAARQKELAVRSNIARKLFGGATAISESRFREAVAKLTQEQAGLFSGSELDRINLIRQEEFVKVAQFERERQVVEETRRKEEQISLFGKKKEKELAEQLVRKRIIAQQKGLPPILVSKGEAEETIERFKQKAFEKKVKEAKEKLRRKRIKETPTSELLKFGAIEVGKKAVDVSQAILTFPFKLGEAFVGPLEKPEIIGKIVIGEKKTRIETVTGKVLEEKAELARGEKDIFLPRLPSAAADVIDVTAELGGFVKGVTKEIFKKPLTGVTPEGKKIFLPPSRIAVPIVEGIENVGAFIKKEPKVAAVIGGAKLLDIVGEVTKEAIKKPVKITTELVIFSEISKPLIAGFRVFKAARIKRKLKVEAGLAKGERVFEDVDIGLGKTERFRPSKFIEDKRRKDILREKALVPEVKDRRLKPLKVEGKVLTKEKLRKLKEAAEKLEEKGLAVELEISELTGVKLKKETISKGGVSVETTLAIPKIEKFLADPKDLKISDKFIADIKGFEKIEIGKVGAKPTLLPDTFKRLLIERQIAEQAIISPAQAFQLRQAQIDLGVFKEPVSKIRVPAGPFDTSIKAPAFKKRVTQDLFVSFDPIDLSKTKDLIVTGKPKKPPKPKKLPLQTIEFMPLLRKGKIPTVFKTDFLIREFKFEVPAKPEVTIDFRKFKIGVGRKESILGELQPKDITRFDTEIIKTIKRGEIKRPDVITIAKPDFLEGRLIKPPKKPKPFVEFTRPSVEFDLKDFVKPISPLDIRVGLGIPPPFKAKKLTLLEIQAVLKQAATKQRRFIEITTKKGKGLLDVKTGKIVLETEKVVDVFDRPFVLPKKKPKFKEPKEKITSFITDTGIVDAGRTQLILKPPKLKAKLKTKITTRQDTFAKLREAIEGKKKPKIKEEFAEAFFEEPQFAGVLPAEKKGLFFIEDIIVKQIPRVDKGFFVGVLPKSKQKTELKFEPSQVIIPRVKPEVALKAFQEPISKLDIITVQEPIAIQEPISKLDTMQITEDITEQIPKLELVPDLFVPPERPPPKEPPPKRPRLRLKFPEPPELIKKLRGFNVEVREGEKRGDKFKRVAGNLPINRALARGKRIVDNFIEASFRVTPSGKKTKLIDQPFAPDLSKFRRPKGKTKLGRNVFVEKRQHRLDSIGELGDISFFKQKAKQKKQRKQGLGVFPI